jgi:hypothetical protein
MRHFFILCLVLSLAACGSTSGIKRADGGKTDLNLSSYENAVILDFSDATKKSNSPAFAGKNFADRIAANISEQGVFKKVSREPLKEKSVVISGAITKYDEGSAGLRLLIGFGAGSSHFEADVKITDSESNQELGQIIVDKNSWALGGIMASAQTPETFMSEAAKKIAKEVAEAKNYSPSQIAQPK